MTCQNGTDGAGDSRVPSRLFGAGLVERRTDGRWRFYTARPRARRPLRSLDETRTARTDE